MHSHKLIAVALVLAMVLTGMIMLMPSASASTIYNTITDAPAEVVVGTEYVYAPDTSLQEWELLIKAGRGATGSVTIEGAAWLSYNSTTKTFSGTPTEIGTYQIRVSSYALWSGETINSWTVEVVDAIPFSFTSSIGTEDAWGCYELRLLTNHEDIVTYTPTTNYPATITVTDENGNSLPTWMVWQNGTLYIHGTSSAGGSWAWIQATRDSQTIEQWIWVTNEPFQWANPSIYAGYNDVYFVGQSANIETPIQGSGQATIVSGPEWALGLETYPSSSTFYPAQAGTFTITVKAVSSINPDWEIYADFNITVWNPIQFVSSNPSMTIAVGQAWSYTPATNNDPFAVIGSYNMPSWISYNSTTKTFTGTPTVAGSNPPLVIYARVVAPSVGTIDEVTQQVYLTVVDEDSSTIAPVADFVPIAGQSSMALSFVDMSNSATAYLWDFGDGSISTVASPYHTYANAGAYNVTLMVANAVGSDSKTVRVSVGTANQPQTSVTKGELYSFTPTRVGDWMSLVDDETAVIVDGPSWLSYDAATGTFSGTPMIVGMYNVSVRLAASSDYGGNKTITWTVNVLEAMPIASFTVNAASGIAPFTVYFLDTSTNAQTYLWTYGDGTNSTLRHTPHTFWNAGYYEVSLTVTNSAGSDTYTEMIHVSAAATTVYFDQGAPETGTVGVLYTYTPDDDSGEWTMIHRGPTSRVTIDGASWLSYNSSTNTFSGVPTAAGYYDVRVSIYLPWYGEKVNGWTIVVSPAAVDPEPEDPATLVPLAAFVCSKISGVGPLNVTFIDYSVRATSWSWNFGDGTGSLERDVVHVFTEAGTYNVTLTVSNEHGNDTYVRTITVTAPVVDDVDDEDDETPGTTGIDLIDKLLTNNVGMALGAVGLLCLGGAAFIRRPLPAIVGILLLIAVYLLVEGWWAI